MNNRVYLGLQTKGFWLPDWLENKCPFGSVCLLVAGSCSLEGYDRSEEIH